LVSACCCCALPRPARQCNREHTMIRHQLQRSVLCGSAAEAHNDKAAIDFFMCRRQQRPHARTAAEACLRQATKPNTQPFRIDCKKRNFARPQRLQPT
jgi:hypothetical protein